ncbi:MAG: DUF1573 domain-containing protein [bacterium]
MMITLRTLKIRTGRLYIAFLLSVFLIYPINSFAAPHITFSDTSFNFGEIHQNQEVDHIFTFQNTGDQVLTIDKVQTSCGCTAAVLSEKSIKQGESGEIKIRFNSGLSQGSQKKTIYVRSNDPAEPVVQLVIEAYVKVDFEVSPPRVYFNQIKKGQTATKEVILKNTGEKSILIKSIDTMPSSFTAKISSEKIKLPISLKQNDSLSITITSEVSTNSPQVTGRVRIETNSQTTPHIIFPIIVTPISTSTVK